MPIIRGFVEKLEIGRAGLVVASLRHDDSSGADYQIADLDADPERFNERLSKLGILRDAMTRAEPVEVEYSTGEGSGPRSIDRVARITRDGVVPTGTTQRASVMIAGIALAAANRTGARAEASDTATVAALAADGTLASFVLDLQMPERDVAAAMLAMLRQAQAEGTAVTLVIDAKQRRIVGVETGDPNAVVGRGDMQIVEGFVESMAVSPALAPMGNLALVEFTTAPAFSGAGNVVGLVPFTPALRQFLVVQGSLEYDLFLAGLRDKLRMRVLTGAEVAQPGGGNDDTGKPDVVKRMASMTQLTSAPMPAPGATGAATAPAEEGQKAPGAALVRAAQLLAALASASRPVWIQISRQSLDEGPAGDRCTEGLPSSDLSPLGLRDLHIPYTAEWVGLGCFNPGVYRLQFTLGVEFEVQVDGKPLCVHASADGTVKFAHACLCGDHEVRVVLKGWTCKMKFEMDVYRIR